MDGIFINLTGKDIILKDNSDDEFILKANPELITGSRRTISNSNYIRGIYNTENSEKNIYLTSTNVSQHVKYPFTEDQIERINSISKGRIRLFVLNKDDVEYWSNGYFQSPFRRYRLFTYDEQLIEYPIPKTYLDVVTETVNSTIIAGKKLYGSIRT